MAAYTYNGAGQRIKKVTQTETRIFHYDLRGHLIAETNQSGQMLVEYIYLGDQLLSMIKPGESIYYFHNDHLGTPQVLTDDSQTIAWKAVYTPFGEAVASIQTVENPFRFPGQYYDQETGLHYNYFRYYNPQTGRYITPDPIGLEGGINLFLYVQNNPTIYIDLFGLWCEQKTPWEEVTCIQKPKFLYGYTKSTWTKIAEWNALPLPSPRGGRVAKIACCCLWEFMGYRKANVYERIILLEATFECYDEATGRSYSEKKYRELSTTYEEIEKLEREIIFEQRRSVTCGVYTGSGTCGCNEPSF